MKKIDLNQTVQIIANLGVVGGLIFLGLEINQNNLMMKSQTRSDVSQSITDMLRQSLDPEIITIGLKAQEDLNSLSAVELNQLQGAYAVAFRVYENVHYQYRMGLFEESDYFAERRAWELNVLSDPIAVRVWCSGREVYSLEFRREIDSLLSSSGCSEIELFR